MKDLRVSVSAVVLECDIEEHVAAHNAFIQRTGLALDDLDVYAEPLGNAVQLVRDLAAGTLTDSKIIEVIRNAAADLVVIDTALAWENSTKAA